MKKIIIALILVSVVLVSCLKSGNGSCNIPDSTVVASATEIADLQTYLNAQSIAATQHSAGFFYKINTVGTGTVIANLCTTVAVSYKARLTNGTIFDSTATGTVATFQLGSLIAGWQKGIPLISKGGKISLYIPPSLGYGASNVTNPTTGAVIIPANSKLVFDIELVDVFN